MSRQQRRNGIWPADSFAVHLWHLFAALEDIQSLASASTRAHDPYDRLALVKKVLVELKSFDAELLPRLHEAIRSSTDEVIAPHIRQQLLEAFGSYHRTVQPKRELLADIRNVVGAHRRGLPDDADRKNFESDFKAWGAWEQHLTDLEAHCELKEWLDFVNAAIALLNQAKDLLPGCWFSIRDGELRVYQPINAQ